MAVNGSTTAEVFEAHLQHFLTPELEEGQVMVMDNLPAHKPERVRELIEERDCELLYVPNYYPEYNPIEEAFSKTKELLRGTCARNSETLVEAIGKHYPRLAPGRPRAYSNTPAAIAPVNYC
jgi:transposase